MRVAIIGAGIAGPTVAWWLKHYGFEPVIYENSPQLRTGGYVIDFWGSGYDVAERMGLIPEIRQRGYDFDTLRLVNSRGRTAAKVDIDVFRAATDNRFVSIARSDLSKLIWQACEEVETHFGVTIDRIDQAPERVEIQLSNGSVEAFDMLVGADGLHSQVRGSVFGTQDRFERPLGYNVAAFSVYGYKPREELAYVAHSLPHRQVARIAARDDETIFFFIFKSHLLDAEPTDASSQRRAIREVFGDMDWEVPQILELLDSANEIYFDRVSQIDMDRWTDDRVALIGDAAACVSLLAGEGTGLAMTEAYVLAGELSQANGDIDHAFRAYESKLRLHLQSKQQAARTMAGVFAPRSYFHMKLRDMAMSVTRVPLLGKWLVGRSLREGLELPKYVGNFNQ